MLAFSITVHKAQGLSLTSAIVDAGPASFGSGMIYVALSRVTKLEGLHLIDFDKTKIVCDQSAVTEYNRLRSLYTPHLGKLEAVHATKRKADSSTEQSSAKCRKKEPMKNCKSGKTRQQPHQVLQPENIAHSLLQQPDRAQQIDIIHTGTEQNNIYQYCEVTSVDEEFQRSTCQRLNLKFDEPENRAQTVDRDVAISKSLEQAIRTKTGQNVSVTVHKIIGDGNCLFRALSLAPTRSQTQHALLRSYLVQHMMDDSVRGPMEQLFVSRQGTNSSFNDYLLNMEQTGVWGTEQEIAAAAHLFDCSIICYSTYSFANFCLQHFSPHFITTANCDNNCHHQTIYLINSTGFHYEAATITMPALDNEP